MPTPKITPDQASIVDATLERQEQYLKRLACPLCEPHLFSFADGRHTAVA
jgi:hypothetical protein